MNRVALRRPAGLLALACLLLVAAAAPSRASAQSTEQAARPAARIGNLTLPTATGFTLKSRAGAISVTVSEETWIIVEKDGLAVEGALSDLVAGKATATAGMLSADGKSLAARTVAQGPAAHRLADRLARVQRRPVVRAMQHLASGTIAAIEGNKITLRGDRVPEVVVMMRPETLVLRGGFSDLGTLKVGEHVQALGTPNRAETSSDRASRTLEAWVLRVDTGATAFFHGRVASEDGDSFVVANVRGRDRLTVRLDGATQYKRVTVANGQAVVATASGADIRVGVHLAVEGTMSPDGRTIQAKAVIVLGAPITGGR